MAQKIQCAEAAPNAASISSQLLKKPPFLVFKNGFVAEMGTNFGLKGPAMVEFG